ncbi:MAG: phosphotransferase [Defluviitaleaceae bacterium]|nr:phosphotransferase [Defluviitaleaceae bacterium]
MLTVCLQKIISPHAKIFIYNRDKSNLLAHKITDDEELERIGREIRDRLKIYDKYPPVLCHTDLSTKNILVNDGEITLIDWDDVYSLCWIHDIAELTFWMKQGYDKKSAEIYRAAFLESYQTEYDINDFYKAEPVLHARISLNSLNYFVNKPQENAIKRLLKDSFEKCGIKGFTVFVPDCRYVS